MQQFAPSQLRPAIAASSEPDPPTLKASSPKAQIHKQLFQKEHLTKKAKQKKKKKQEKQNQQEKKSSGVKKEGEEE